ncbi:MULTISPECIES: response regulator transcription factor [unclassified Herbaspirillum]|uniref:response regulator transcription factor n=1 Tax=unclassified Herbaspirillum TaxID=2624150 RepID=UPI00114EA824|nr:MULTISPECIES: response regulator transcription factor [unclassified Herbaspirillum]MBB5393419.1 DNA-binding NarL/FixJ family response regulator [Herbaspirillum sp. SJZ102]TQK03833.1 LuxR family two component transcriptional regulator [Herbaspirillum sp. SJZ130]TQK08565.1 LuxR family two component transcriptional regulator [Herbaspirillum sp. SJZ106]
MISTTFDRHVVLIVDDMPDNLAMLSDALDESGHIVLVATDGLSALERLDRITPDLILLDAMMPGIDGFETCRRIKLIRSVNHVPVVFMTGLSETEHVVRGFEVGGIDYVTKPIRPQEVVARIGAHIRTARMMSQTRGVLEHAAHAVIVLGHNGLPLWQTSKASLWLEKYFAGAGHKLPAALQSWLNESLVRHRQDGGKIEDIPPLALRQGECELRIAVSGAGAGHGLTLLLEEKHLAAAAPAGGETPPCIEGFRLTPRENDVLMWLGKGKTNRDIADILGMSPRTVNKHLEHIFVKLGVETRSAAAVLASNGLLQ